MLIKMIRCDICGVTCEEKKVSFERRDYVTVDRVDYCKDCARVVTIHEHIERAVKIANESEQ